MGYINNFLMYKDLINRSHDLGVDGVLVVDIPGELSLEDYGIDNQDLDVISLVSPTTSQERVKEIVKNSTGFIYYVTLRGVTGSSNLDGKEIEENIKYIKSISSIPVMAGFGIKSSDDAKLLSSFSDGIVIGSSIVELIHKNSENKDFHEVSDYISNMKMQLDNELAYKINSVNREKVLQNQKARFLMVFGLPVHHAKQRYQPTSKTYVCPKCDHHLRIGARTRFNIFFDNGNFTEVASNIETRSFRL